jgi:hypothetical protein
MTIRQNRTTLADFTCWQVYAFGGGGNDMSLPNPHAENHTAHARRCAQSPANSDISGTKHNIQSSG